MKPRPFSPMVGLIALGCFFLGLAAALFFSGASLSHLTIRDLGKPFSWWEILAYFGISIPVWYLVAVLKRRHSKGNEKITDESK